jgi:predicted permease
VIGMEWLWQNLGYAVRVLGRSPGFTAVAVLSLALGIGANTAIFTLINTLLLRNVPVRQPERLVQLSVVRQDAKIPFSYPMFREVERGQRVFTGVVGWGVTGMFNVEVDGVLARNHVLTVTGNCYSELGVTPLLGRLFTPDDSNPSSGANSQVAVIGYEFWQGRFGGALDVVGKLIRVEGHPFTIVGVTRKWFTGLSVGEPPEITLPITAAPVLQGWTFGLDNRSLLWLFVTARLNDGVTIEQARAQLQSFWPEVLLATASTDTPGLRRQTFLSMGLQVSSAAKGIAVDLRSQFTRPLYVLAGIVGLILLLACVNLASLMLARAAARGHEMSVRVAMGATRWPLARQVLTETLALSFAGALLGLAFAYWGSRLLLVLMTQGNLFPVTLDLAPDLRVLVVTMLVAILTGIFFGLAPAWRCSREDPASALQQNARNFGGGTGKLRKALIVAQVALSLVLLLGAGLLVRTFEKLRSIDLGFQKESVLEISLSPQPGGSDKLDINGYHQQLLKRISSLPGVRSAGYSDSVLVSGLQEGWRENVSAMSADPATGVAARATGTMVSPGFFQTLGIQLLRGRDFDETDDERHPRIAIVNSSLAKRLFPNGDAIGKTVRLGFMPEYQNIEIVGIVGDARIVDLRYASAPVIFLSYLQEPRQSGNLLVRTDKAPETLAKTLGHEIESFGHEYAVSTRTISQVISDQLVEERVTAMLSGFFAVLALLLASVGVYGLMSYAVTRCTREIGIRVALGAQQNNVLWSVLRETLALALFGIALGVPAALVATRLIAGMLFGLSPSDVPTITGASLLLLLVAFLAGYLPARRASGIDPMIALRMD